jgi:hypothetical protein
MDLDQLRLLFVDLNYFNLFYQNFYRMKIKLLSVFLFVIFFNAHAQTNGSMTFNFTQVAKSPCYSGTRHVMAVWIQTNAGGFVKTKMRYAGNSTCDHLPTWSVNAGGSTSNCMSTMCNTTDATTGATLNSFGARSITWDGKGVNGTANGTTVADGVYKITIQETWNHGSTSTTTRSYTFTKGPNADHQAPADDADFKTMTIDWTPSNSGIESIDSKPLIEVYPNPSTGIVSIDYSKATAIKVFNVLGEVVCEVIPSELEEGTEALDLSALNNGLYNVMVYNGNASASYKLVLQK